MNVDIEAVEEVKVLMNRVGNELNKLIEVERMKQKRKARNCCTRDEFKYRNAISFYGMTFKRIKEVDHKQFFVYTRMTPKVFDEILSDIGPLLQKNSVKIALSPQCRLALFLVFATQGTPIKELSSSFKIGKETVRLIILQTAEVIWNMYEPLYAADPSIEDYKTISDDYWNKLQIPNCLGSLNGIHISFRTPGNLHKGENKYDSIVLLAACDIKYCFTHIDVGTYGNKNKTDVFEKSTFGKNLINQSLLIPKSQKLPESDTIMPYYFVGNTSLPLEKHLMRPFAGINQPMDRQIFNQRLSEANLIIENAFGALVARFRVLLNSLTLLPANSIKIVLACVVLHNYLMLNNESKKDYCPENYIDWTDANGIQHAGKWRSEIEDPVTPIATNGSNHFGGALSIKIRNTLKDFFYVQHSKSN